MSDANQNLSTKNYLDCFDIVEFVCIDPSKTRKRAYQVGDYLAVTTYDKFFKVYRLDNGKPLVKSFFEKAEDALKWAEDIDRIYAEYFCLWMEYPDANIFELAQWSIKNGTDICKIIKSMPKRVSSLAWQTS